MAGEGGDGRRARWQLLRVVGQVGQMAGVVGQEADSREPDGARAVGQGGSDARREEMTGCMRVRWQLLGVVGVAWSMSSRWWAGRGPDQGVRGR